MVFKLNSPVYSTDLQRKEGENILYINYLGAPIVPSIADSAEVMVRVVDALADNPEVSRVILVQQRNYNYPFEQVSMLLEIAQLYTYLLKQERILAPDKLILFSGLDFVPGELSYLLGLLRQDPASCYLEIVKRIASYRKNSLRDAHLNTYIGFLERFRDLLSKTKLISSLIDVIDTYGVGDRKVYYSIFRPDILPNFTFTRLVAQIPETAEIIDQYEVHSGFEDISVMVLKIEGDSKYLYHIMPPEYSLSEEHHYLLNLGKNVLLEYQPKSEEFVDSEKVRSLFFNVARDLISELSQNKKIPLNYRELNGLAKILVRQTIGFGLIEVLLFDNNLQDIFLNAPIGQNYVFVRHGKYGDCVTNILPSYEDAEGWASKLRLQSGRPLDEANPILDTDLFFGNIRARVAAIQRPLSPTGIAYALRRHREDPWTLPLFINNKMINSFTAGLMSFLIDGNRTLLIAGTRSSGKCVDGNTLVQLSDGSIQKIKSLVGEEKQKIEDGIIYNPINNARVQTLENLKISSQPITDVWRRESPLRLIKIKTRSGKEIITTYEHPYFIYNKGLQNKRADELKAGDLIASPRNLKIAGQENVFYLRNKPYYKSETEDSFYLGGKTNSSLVKFPKKMTKEFAEFIGLVIGDGHLDLTKLEFHNSCQELRERYISLLTLFEIKYRIFDSNTTTVVQVTARALNRAISEIFEIPFGNKSSKVIIPTIILKSDNVVLAAFLKGYFDTDGYVSIRNREIELATASNVMSNHLQLALLRFGITSFIKPKKIKGVYYYRILIRGGFVNKFADKIGFNHPLKKEKLKLLISKRYIRNTNVDVIPQGNEIINNLRCLLRVSPKAFRLSGKDYWTHQTKQYRVTRDCFAKIVPFLRERYASLLSMESQVDSLRKFLNFDIKNYLGKILQLKELLSLSYISLSIDVGISDSGMRKILRNSNTNVQILSKLNNLTKLFNNRLKEMELLNCLECSLENLPIFCKTGICSYAHISQSTGISESMLKYYAYGSETEVSIDKRSIIENSLVDIKKKLSINIKNAFSLINSLYSLNFISDFINMGLIISYFRDTLNISNEEFSKDNISVTTVSNFFTGRYSPSIDTLQSIIKTVLSHYDSAVSSQVNDALTEAEDLSNSDIFWDEISSAEIIEKVDEYVYDFTVKDTHNFVANGLIAHNTSLLGSVMLEVIPSVRTLVIEDTLELPVDSLRKLGYNIQRMKVRSALLEATTEVEASEGIRASLRLGDSALIVGEVRSSEAKALYEAMRVGALANLVAGTIHGASPYGVFDRVVNDLGVPVTSFKATDIIAIANPIRTPDGLHYKKRVVQLTEVRKHWTRDPEEEKGFVDLVRYNVEKDELEPTDDLMNGDSEIIKAIAGSVKGWAGNWDAVWDNILLRGKIKQEIVDVAKKMQMPQLMESKFNALSNDMFHRISEKITAEVGLPVSERVFPEWRSWLMNSVRGG